MHSYITKRTEISAIRHNLSNTDALKSEKRQKKNNPKNLKEQK